MRYQLLIPQILIYQQFNLQTITIVGQGRGCRRMFFFFASFSRIAKAVQFKTGVG
jgi:hypothetical protein